ncbi:MAG: GC-type dockerin domain-anchored protein [Planctomycetota bacterium]
MPVKRVNARNAATIASAGLWVGAAAPVAALPPLGGEMNHVNITLSGGAFGVFIDSADPMILQGPGSGLSGAEGVLNGMHFNGQYGWLPAGFWGPPPGGAVWVEQREPVPGLVCYAGRSQLGTTVFEPLHFTEGADPGFMWDGAMTHNYFAARRHGTYVAPFRVYMGDSSGTMLSGFEPVEMDLVFRLEIDPCDRADYSTTGSNPGDAAFGFADGVIDVTDLTYFVEAWVSGDLADADVTTAETNPGDEGWGERDGAITISDLTWYIERWISGCG